MLQVWKQKQNSSEKKPPLATTQTPDKSLKEDLSKKYATEEVKGETRREELTASPSLQKLRIVIGSEEHARKGKKSTEKSRDDNPHERSVFE